MRRTANISRIVTCATVTLYTLLACYHVAQTVRYMCYRITPIGEEYVMGLDSITAEAWFFIVSGVVLLALGTVTVVFLFRKGIASAVVACAATLTSAIYGMRLNTMLSEVTLWREIVRALGLPFEVGLFVKPFLGGLCIAAAACYAVLCLVIYKKHQTWGKT